MKLLRFGALNEEKPGVLDNQGSIRDLSSIIPDFNAQTLGRADLFQQLQTLDLEQLPRVDKNVRIGSSVSVQGKLICVGFNSKLHAKEMGVEPLGSADMVVFTKANSSVCGAYDPILHTRHTKKLDWEAELGVVIGKKGKYIEQHLASQYIFGFTCVNDLSERYLQMETTDRQFTKGKSFDNAAPIGPYLVTKDEVPDAGNLRIQLWVNDELRQDFNTADYLHSVEEVISYLSQFFTLYPGDVISMGSAPGSARSWGDCFLKPNDRVTLCINGLGQQEQRVVVE